MSALITAYNCYNEYGKKCQKITNLRIRRVRKHEIGKNCKIAVFLVNIQQMW